MGNIALQKFCLLAIVSSLFAHTAFPASFEDKKIAKDEWHACSQQKPWSAEETEFFTKTLDEVVSRSSKCTSQISPLCDEIKSIIKKIDFYRFDNSCVLMPKGIHKKRKSYAKTMIAGGNKIKMYIYDSFLSDAKIAIRLGGSKEKIDLGFRVLVHELVHAVDYMNGKKSDSDEFSKMIKYSADDSSAEVQMKECALLVNKNEMLECWFSKSKDGLPSLYSYKMPEEAYAEIGTALFLDGSSAEVSHSIRNWYLKSVQKKKPRLETSVLRDDFLPIVDSTQ